MDDSYEGRLKAVTIEGLPEHRNAFGESLAQRGSRVNRMMYDLRIPANREAFLKDREEYFDRYQLTSTERQLINDGNWSGLTEAGGNIYVMTKLGATLGVSLMAMGRQMQIGSS